MKIVFIVSRIPYPLEKGDKLRAYHQLKHLSKTNEVHLLCLNDDKLTHDAVKHLQAICAGVTVYKLSKIKIAWRLFLALFSKKPYQVHYFYDKQVARSITRQIKKLNPDHIYCQLIRTTEYIKNLYQYPKTLDYMDAFSKGMYRRIENENFITRLFVQAEANRLTTYENLIFDYFDHKTIISEQDRDCIYHKNRKEIIVIPNGVSDELVHDTTQVEKAYDLLFHGNLGYIPNIDCVKYIVNDIMPELLKEHPHISLAISGATPSAKVVELCKKYPANITLLGYVDDIVVTYKRACIFFAPLQIGTGLQNKILEAMSLHVPCITSELCNNALKGTPGVHIYTAKNPRGYIHAITSLLGNPAEAAEVARNGHRFIAEHFSWERGTFELLNLFKQPVPQTAE